MLSTLLDSKKFRKGGLISINETNVVLTSESQNIIPYEEFAEMFKKFRDLNDNNVNNNNNNNINNDDKEVIKISNENYNNNKGLND